VARKRVSHKVHDDLERVLCQRRLFHRLRASEHDRLNAFLDFHDAVASRKSDDAQDRGQRVVFWMTLTWRTTAGVSAVLMVLDCSSITSKQPFVQVSARWRLHLHVGDLQGGVV